MHDLEVVYNDGTGLGLLLNEQLFNVTCADLAVKESFLHLLNVQVVEPEYAALLGFPTGEVSSISKALKINIESLKLMEDRLVPLCP